MIRPTAGAAAILLAASPGWVAAQGGSRLERFAGGMAVVRKLDTTEYRFAVTMCAANIAHVTYAPSRQPIAPTALLAANACADTLQGMRRWDALDTMALIVTTSAMRIELRRRGPILQVFDSAGTLLLRDEQRRLEKGHAYNIFSVQHDAGIYGLGQHQSGALDLSGQYVPLTPQNTNISIPFLVSSSGFGLLWNTGGVAAMNDRDRVDLIFSADSVPAIDYFVIVGPSLDRVIAGYRSITGSAPMLPKWAYGYWQSKNRYRDQGELLRVASEYRRRGLPIDAIVQDLGWWTLWGSHEFDRARFPDPAAMFDSLHRMHLHAMLSVWPTFKPGSANEAFMRRNGYMIQGTDVYDATNPAARSAYWAMADTALFAKGVDGWWLDASEPETSLQGNDNILGDVTRGIDRVFAGTGVRFANSYALMHTAGVYAGQRSRDSTKRVVILARSGTADQQRNSAISWSGDIWSDWNSFRRQIPAGLNFSLGGIPYWTTDIGGFAAKLPWGDVRSPAYRELYVRWFQYGAFCPIFRTHGTRYDSELKRPSDRSGDGTNAGNELWSYGPEAERILARFDTLRYRLLPYIYSLAWRTTKDGYTPMRALVMDWREDKRVREIADQFMFGPALLVSPVTDSGATTRLVYLPRGEWYDFWFGNRVRGGRTITANAPLDRMPLFVRAGSILPLGRAIQHSGESPDPIELRVYSGADGGFVLYDDAGDGYGYEKGQYSLLPLSWNDQTKALRFGARVGAYPGMSAARDFRVVLVGRDRGGGIAPAREAASIRYTGVEVTVSLR